MSYVVVDVEADGPIPGDYSMLSFGAVLLDDIDEGYYVELAPISDRFIPDALKVSGLNRDYLIEHGTPPKVAMQGFADWLKDIERPMFVSDNAGFDWMFVAWYFHHFLGTNPFGWSSTSITSLYKGVEKNMKASFKRLRKTAHTHNALDDATGNAEALQAIRKMGVRNL